MSARFAVSPGSLAIRQRQRRVHLDLTGRLPEPEVIRTFLADGDPAKREKMIDELMTTPSGKWPLVYHRSESKTPFLDRWAYFCCDLFRSSEGHLGKGSVLFHDYLYMGLLFNVPYNELVKEMLTAQARSNWQVAASNFLTRNSVGDNNAEGKVNAEDTYDEIAVTSTKLLLGVDLAGC